MEFNTCISIICRNTKISSFGLAEFVVDQEFCGQAYFQRIGFFDSFIFQALSLTKTLSVTVYKS